MNNHSIISKKVLRTILLVLVIGLGVGKGFGQNGNYPGLPGDHGLDDNQNANTGNPTTTTQTLTLNAGWNWISFFVECDNNLLSSFQETIAQNNASAMIKDMTFSTMLEDESWSDSDLSFTNESMFMVNLENATTVTLTAQRANPANHPITINPGWNWIGFPLDHAMTVAEAFSSITPHSGDMIKSMTESSSYNGSSWEGSLEDLTPGNGFMYYNNGETMTLTYPSSK